MLARLSSVRPTAPGQWLASCPSHLDSHGSLCISIGAKEDALVLHCLAGCHTTDVMAALGLKWDDLFGRPGGLGPVTSKVSTNGRNYQLWSKVYAYYTGALGLSDEHREALHKRGLNDDQIRAHGYRTLGPCGFLGEADVPFHQVPGFQRDQKGAWSTVVREGLVIPIYNMSGHIRALQVRVPTAVRYMWFSGGPGGTCGSPCHVPLQAADGILAKKPLRVTEGAIKANVCQALTGMATVGLPGAGLWKSCLPLIERYRPTEVRLAFDMDWKVNSGVRQARRDLARAAAKAGVSVVVAEKWDEKFKGIDDALAAGADITEDEVDTGSHLKGGVG